MQRDPTKAEGCQQILRAGKVATAGHPGDRLAAEQGIEAVATQFALQHLGAAQDVLVAMARLVPMADAVAGRGGGHEIEPVEARVRRLGGDHLHEIAVL